jgi:hypothetical protein
MNILSLLHKNWVNEHIFIGFIFEEGNEIMYSEPQFKCGTQVQTKQSTKKSTCTTIINTLCMDKNELFITLCSQRKEKKNHNSYPIFLFIKCMITFIALYCECVVNTHTTHFRISFEISLVFL